MRKTLAAAIVTTFLALPAAASAQLSLGVRLGYGVVGGDVIKDVKLSTWIDHEIPLQLEAMLKILPSLSLGAYYSYGFSTVAGGSGIDSAHDTKAGVQAALSLLEGEKLAPWIGAGAGWGWLSAKGGGNDVTIDGWDLKVEGGLDYKVADASALGVFASYAFGQYSNGKITIPGTKWASGSIGSGEVATHGLFTIGVRGRLGL